jgi:signal transduction histidine kinase
MKSWQKQKQFVADASHELKTPLASLGATVDAIQSSGEESVKSQKVWFDNIQSEVKRMNRLIGDLLYLSEAEDAEEESEFFDLSLTCERALASMEASFYKKNIQLTAEIEKDIFLTGSKDRTAQAILILLDNAVKYTNEGGCTLVCLKRHKQQAELCVQNTGEGIPADDLPKVFDRFFRGDRSRSKESDSYGLGLSIAKAIVERGGGKLTVTSASGLTIFTIILK